MKQISSKNAARVFLVYGHLFLGLTYIPRPSLLNILSPSHLFFILIQQKEAQMPQASVYRLPAIAEIESEARYCNPDSYFILQNARGITMRRNKCQSFVFFNYIHGCQRQSKYFPRFNYLNFQDQNIKYRTYAHVSLQNNLFVKQRAAISGILNF